MKTISQALPIALTLLASTVSWSPVMGQMSPDSPAMMSMADTTKNLEPLKGKEFETAFLTGMIGHHRSALEMAKLVSAHTQRPELNRLAGNLIADQTKQIAEMSAWLQAWYGQSTDETVMAMPGMDDLAAANGAEFDRKFVSLMVEHHQAALDMAELVAARAEHPELKALAARIVDAQTREIREMNDWKQAWF